MERSNSKKILPSPILKRKAKPVAIKDRVQLERVLGLTVTNNASLSVDPNTGTIAYPAGCVVVLYNHKKGRQTHLISPEKKTITCLAFSGDGKNLVTGECGHQPAVRVYDVEDGTPIAAFNGHKFGVNCVAFSPNLKYIVSIGSQHDMQVNVWNWKTGVKVASNKVACKVVDLAFNEDGSVFVTVGNRHVKFWFMDTSKARVKEVVPLVGRSGILGEQKNNYFCGVACGLGPLSSSTFCITQSGLLCEFNSKRLLDKWVELRTTCANSISVGENHIFVGCAQGIVRVFDPVTLRFVATMPRPHYLGVDVAAGLDPSHMRGHQENSSFPDTTALVLDDIDKKVTCVYNDHSIYIWDVKDVKRVGKTRSYLYHSQSIWGIEVYPECKEQNQYVSLPANSFITCSSDDTIRIWNLDPAMATNTPLKRNIYSSELLKVIYTDPEHNNLCEKDFNPAGKKDKTDTGYNEKYGVRSIKVSPDGQHLASGDRQGNIRIHNLQTMNQKTMLEAHDSEVLSLEFNRPETGVQLLASAGRDRLLHVFDVEQGYGLVQTLDDHSSAITAVRFMEHDGQLNMLSCGADKSLIFRSAQKDPDFQFQLNRHIVGKVTMYDMAVDPSNKFVSTACQDRNVRIYNIKNGKQKKCYKGSLGDDGTLIRVEIDPSGAYVATSCSDKNLYIYDFFSGECVATMCGHSEIITGVMFTNDLRHLVSVSGDGCMFIWRLPFEFSEYMHSRLVQLGHNPKKLNVENDTRGVAVNMSLRADGMNNPDDVDFPVMQKRPTPGTPSPLKQPMPNPEGGAPDYRFSVGQLPTWAKKQVLQEPGTKGGGNNPASQAGPRGRWAQRAEGQEVAIKSLIDNTVDSVSEDEKKRLTEEVNPLAQQMREIRRETIVLARTSNKPTNVPIIEDDEGNQDDEDDDDEFSVHNREQLVNTKAQTETPGAVTLSRGNAFTSARRPGDLPLRRANSNDFLDLENKEVIYLPNEDGSEEGSEGTVSSYQVKQISANDTIISTTESEDADRQSWEEWSDFDSSEPSTPHDPTGGTFLLEDPQSFEFLQSNFDLGMASQDLSKELHPSFAAPLSRQSISTRFLSRSQDTQQRNLPNTNGIPKKAGQSLHMQALQRKREETARAVDETRRRLQALGFADPKHTVKPDPQLLPERDTPGAPCQQQSAASKNKQSEAEQENAQRTRLSLPAQDGSNVKPPRRPSTDDASSSVNIDIDPPSPTMENGQVSQTRLSHHGDLDDLPHTTSPPKSKSEGNLRVAGEDKRRRSVQRVHSYQMQTQSSKAKMSKTPSHGALNKITNGTVTTPTTEVGMTKSRSTLAINGGNGGPRRSSLARKGRMNSALKVKFKSTPDLLSSTAMVSGDHDDALDNIKMKAEDQLGSLRRSVTPDNTLDRAISSSLENLKGTLSLSPDPVDTISDEPKILSSPDESSGKLVRNNDDNLKKGLPTMGITVKSSKQDALMKKAAQSKRRSASDMTLAKAKEILLSKSSTFAKDLANKFNKVEEKSSVSSSLENQNSKQTAARMSSDLTVRPNENANLSSHKEHHESVSSLPVRKKQDYDASPQELPVKDCAPSREQTVVMRRNSGEHGGIRMGVGGTLGQTAVVLPDSKPVNIDKSKRRLSGGFSFNKSPGSGSREGSASNSPKQSPGNSRVSLRSLPSLPGKLDGSGKDPEPSPPSKDVTYSVSHSESMPNLKAHQEANGRPLSKPDKPPQDIRTTLNMRSPNGVTGRKLPVSPSQFLENLKKEPLPRRGWFSNKGEGHPVGDVRLKESSLSPTEATECTSPPPGDSGDGRSSVSSLTSRSGAGSPSVYLKPAPPSSLLGPISRSSSSSSMDQMSKRSAESSSGQPSWLQRHLEPEGEPDEQGSGDEDSPRVEAPDVDDRDVVPGSPIDVVPGSPIDVSEPADSSLHEQEAIDVSDLASTPVPTLPTSPPPPPRDLSSPDSSSPNGQDQITEEDSAIADSPNDSISSQMTMTSPIRSEVRVKDVAEFSCQTDEPGPMILSQELLKSMERAAQIYQQIEQDPDLLDIEDPFQCAEQLCDTFTKVQDILNQILGPRPGSRQDQSTMAQPDSTDTSTNTTIHTANQEAQTDRQTVPTAGDIQHSMAPMFQQFSQGIHQLLQNCVNPTDTAQTDSTDV